MKKINILVFIMSLGIFFSSCKEDVLPPNAKFSKTIDGLKVKFTSASIGAETYKWEFGDSNTSAEESPTHTYVKGGTYDVKLTVTNEGGTSSTNESITVVEPFNEAAIAGTYKITAAAGSLAVGPAEGSSEWWTLPAAELTLRACQLDDEFIFNANGTFSMNLQSSTFLEDWQGGAFACGAPVAPHDGKGTYTFKAADSKITLNGAGAFIALPKVNNDGELPKVKVPTSITYKVAEFKKDGTNKTMKLSIEAGSGVWWTFKLTAK